MTRARSVGLILAASAGALAAPPTPLSSRTPIDAAQGRAPAQAPVFEIDPFWPKPLPHHWVLGSTIGVSVDERDYVWILHRPQAVDDNFKAADFKPPIGTCCREAPPVLEFDRAGNLVDHWGGPGPGYEWPERNHGITVDHHGNVWIGGNGNTDRHVLKFTKTGTFLLQLGRQGTHDGSNDLVKFWRPAKIFPDPNTRRSGSVWDMTFSRDSRQKAGT